MVCRAGEGLEPPFVLFSSIRTTSTFGQVNFSVAQQLMAQGHRAPHAENNVRVGSCVVTCLLVYGHERGLEPSFLTATSCLSSLEQCVLSVS